LVAVPPVVAGGLVLGAGSVLGGACDPPSEDEQPASPSNIARASAGPRDRRRTGEWLTASTLLPSLR
jgi:hypothetical protein